MRKLVFLLLLSIISGAGFAQKKIQEIRVVSSTGIAGMGEGKYKITSPVFNHEGTTLTADSANLNTEGNLFDAFGHVVITQPDGTVIYSDVLNYYGNTKIALLTRNVRMVDKNGAVLTTNYLHYDMNTKIGTYTNGGKIVNGEDVLTSKNGYYFGNSKDSYFRHDVVVTSKDAITKSDTLKYNSDTKVAYFFGPTHIYGKKDTMYTEDGNYNTVTRQAFGVKNNLYQQGTKTLKGDTIFYDDIQGIGRAFKNIEFKDVGREKITLIGDYGLYKRADSSTLVTKNAYTTMLTQDSAKVDTIFLTADTLFTKLIEKRTFKPIVRSDNYEALIPPDETGGEDAAPVAGRPARGGLAVPRPKVAAAPKKPEKVRKRDKKTKKDESTAAPVDSVAASDSIPISKTDTTVKYRPKTKAELRDSIRQDSIRKDSIVLSQDTSKTRIVLAYHHVKIFKTDLQAKADSAFFSTKDSIVRCFKNPIVWSQGSQLSADTIYMQLKNQKLDNMILQRKGFIVNVQPDSLKYNQVKGKVIIGYFKDNKLSRMHVFGNAESVYYISDSTGYTNMNRTLSGKMRIEFADDEVTDILTIGKPSGKIYPIETIPKDTEILEGFIWKPKERPLSKEDIIPSLKKKKYKKSAPAKTAPKKTVPVTKPGTGKPPVVKPGAGKPAATTVPVKTGAATVNPPVTKK